MIQNQSSPAPTRVRALLNVQSATLVLATAGVFGAMVDLPVPTVIASRAAIAVPGVCVIAMLRGNSLRLRLNRETALLVFTGVLLAVHWITYFHSVRVSSVAIGSLVTFSFPVMTAIAEPFVFGERYRWYTIMNALLIVVGMAIISEIYIGRSVVLEGVVWGLISAALYTARNLISRNMATADDAERVMITQLLVVAAVLSLFLFTADWSSLQLADWSVLVLLGLLSTAVGHTLFIRALNRVGAATASIGVGLQPVYAAILAYFFVREVPGVSTVLGAIFILGAVLHQSARRLRETK